MEIATSMHDAGIQDQNMDDILYTHNDLFWRAACLHEA